MENVKIENTEKLFVDINPDNPVTEIESFCVSCGENGITRILLTKIPYFKEIIVMAFSCDKCGYKSSEVQPGRELAEHGIHFELNVNSQKVNLFNLIFKDLNRKVIKSEHATIQIPEIDLEIPPNTQKGKLTTIEGFISTAKDQIEAALNDGVYDEMDEEYREKIKSLIQKFDDVITLKTLPVKFIIDDPAGNSFIENPFAPQTDPYIKVAYYERTKEMAEKMGYMIQSENKEKEEINEPESEIKVDTEKVIKASSKEFVNPTYYDRKKDFTVYKPNSEIYAHLIDFTKSIENNTDIKQEALKFPTNCYCCNFPGENYMCICTIPYFKEIIITCFKCQNCGYKTTDVKGGGGMSDKATKITLKVKSKKDLNRDVFKSETAKISIPELEFETDTGSMGSMFTTVEGVIDKLATSLNDIPFSQGDSVENNGLENFIKKLRELISDEKEFTLIIDDPLSNSFIHSPCFPETDPDMIKEEYDRTWEQNEELGINDMKVENYGEDSNK